MRADHEYSTHFSIGQTVGPLELVADGVKLATYSETDSATGNKSLQNTYIGRSRRAEHEYGICFSVGQTVSPLKVIKVWRQIWHIV